jgi:hypothetical protein
MSSSGVAGPIGCELRNAVVRLCSGFPMMRQFQWPALENLIQAV